MKLTVALSAATMLFATAAHADLITVEIRGEVGFNSINDGLLGGVSSGDQATMSFTVDSDVFDEGIPGDTRGYVINENSYSLSFDSGVDVGLLDPFPAGQTPYFTLVDGFPVSDGFFVSTSPFSPGGVPLEQEPFNANLELGYGGDTLDSLDILDAVGTYGFDGLTRFGFTVWAINPDNVRMEMEFIEMTISVPAPGAALLLPLGVLVGRRRR